MFEILPAWVGDVMLIVAFILGPTGIIWSVLNQKGANRKLVVEEGDQDLKEFSALTHTYRELLAESQKATQAALEEVRESKVQREQLQTELDEVRDTQRRLRTLFNRVIAQYKIELTEEEQAEFDATHLRRRTTRRMP